MPQNLLYWIVVIILVIVLVYVVVSLLGGLDASTASDVAEVLRRHKAH